MVFWHWLFGIGLGVIATLIITNRAIPYTNQSHTTGPRRRKSSFVQDLNDRCPVCLEGMSVQYLNCGHALHKECLENLKTERSECPTCREPITERNEPITQMNKNYS